MPKKLVVPFIKIPHERNPALMSVSIFCRGIAMELYMFGCNFSDSGYDPSPIPIYGNWHVCLAKHLQVDPAERGNFARMLDRLAEVGVLVVEGSFVHVRYAAPKWTPSGPAPDPGPPPVRDQSEASPPKVRDQSVQGPPQVRQDLTPRNDSTHVSQIREDKKREEESERRARERLVDPEPEKTAKRIGNDWMLEATCIAWQRFDEDLSLIGMKPADERARALEGFRADPWHAKNISVCSPKFVLRKWPHLIRGAPAMQLVAAKPADAPKSELEKLYDDYAMIQKKRDACLYDEEDLKARLTARMAEVHAKIQQLKGTGYAKPA